MEDKLMIEKFIAWLKEQVGSIYVWGGQGEVDFNEAWIEKVENSKENAKRAVAFYRKQLATGRDPIAAYDCSGLVVRFFLDNRIIYSDMTARGLYAISNPIKEVELMPGDLVFRHDGEKIHHVGVFIGNNKVIHARGRDYGVVEEGLHDNSPAYWNRFGRIPSLCEIAQEAPQKNNYPKLMCYGGATFVNVRTVPTAASLDTVIDKVCNGETVLVLGLTENNWAEVIKQNNNGFVRGYCLSKFLNDSDKMLSVA